MGFKSAFEGLNGRIFVRKPRLSARVVAQKKKKKKKRRCV